MDERRRTDAEGEGEGREGEGKRDEGKGREGRRKEGGRTGRRLRCWRWEEAWTSIYRPRPLPALPLPALPALPSARPALCPPCPPCPPCPFRVVHVLGRVRGEEEGIAGTWGEKRWGVSFLF